MRNTFDPNLEQQIVNLLLRGYENQAISDELKVTTRRVKSYMKRMFTRYNINSGIKRVKLAMLLYKEQNEGSLREQNFN